tara:strand:+ start:709 stop:996 length:288 start_codon:yes stop_codon:yes gene_type:complete
MKQEYSKNEQLDLLLLLATFKSFSEQMYNMKDVHKGIVKRRFNILLNAINGYEKVLDSDWLKENIDVMEQLSDAVTDMVYTIRDKVEQEEREQAT